MNVESSETWYGSDKVWTARASDDTCQGDRAFGLTKHDAESNAIDNYLRAKNGDLG